MLYAAADPPMRVIVFIKSTADSEAGVMPGPELLGAMEQFNAALMEAGIMVDGNGIKPSSAGFRVRFDGESRILTQGPFGPVKELVAGYWIWQVRDMDEALEWVMRCPNPMLQPSDIEILPLFEPEDFD